MSFIRSVIDSYIKRKKIEKAIKLTIPDYLKKEMDSASIVKEKKVRNALRIAVSGITGFSLSLLLLLLSLEVNILHNLLLGFVLLVPGACFGVISGVCYENLLKSKKRKSKERSLFSLPIIVITPVTALLYVLILYLGMSIVDTVSVPEATLQKGEGCFIKDDMTVLSLIQEESWSDMNVEERIAFSQYIADNEAILNGLPYRLEVVASRNLPEGVGGRYQHKTKRIVVNEKYIEAKETTAFNIINVIAHECQHAVQFTEIEMLQSVDERYQNLQIFQTIKVVADEFANYTGVGSKGYSEQFCEKQAVEKAEERMKYYIMLLEKDGK